MLARFIYTIQYIVYVVFYRLISFVWQLCCWSIDLINVCQYIVFLCAHTHTQTYTNTAYTVASICQYTRHTPKSHTKWKLCDSILYMEKKCIYISNDIQFVSWPSFWFAVSMPAIHLFLFISLCSSFHISTYILNISFYALLQKYSELVRPACKCTDWIVV